MSVGGYYHWFYVFFSFYDAGIFYYVDVCYRDYHPKHHARVRIVGQVDFVLSMVASREFLECCLWCIMSVLSMSAMTSAGKGSV